MRGRATGGTYQGGAGNGTQVNHRLTARHRRGNTHRSLFSFGRIIGINTEILHGTRRFHHLKDLLC